MKLTFLRIAVFVYFGQYIAETYFCLFSNSERNISPVQWLSFEVFQDFKVFLKISKNSQENNCVRVSFLIKLQVIEKQTLVHVFSCEICKVLKNAFLYRTPPVAASVLKTWRTAILLKRDSSTGVFLWILLIIFKNSFFYRTLPLAASALNLTLRFQAVNSGCSIWSRELLLTCSFMCSFIFVIFYSHVGI